MEADALAILAQVFAQLSEQLARTERLGDVTVAAGRTRLGLISAQGVGGDGDDGSATQGRIALDAARRLVAVDHRKVDVHQDQIGPFLLCQLDALLPVRGLDQLIAGAAQKVTQDGAVVLLVFDNKDASGHAAPLRCSTLTGNSTWKVEPLPGSDFTKMRPPCNSTMRLAIARPRPVPPFFLVLELSSWWNSLKIRPCSDAGMPGPVSATATQNIALAI